ncbi:MAG: hypothetical protein LQ337_003316 [Flavoplaca oasis]|nr:MAG: hypothetical protein LQ337_003316 [Flavoplaca oasis]
MKFQYCLAAALSMLLAFLGQSIALYLPASRVNTTSTDTVGLGPALKRGVSLYCYSSDADAAFFERSAENWEASNAGNNYVSFAQNMVQSPGWAGRESEPFLFAQRTIGLDGFECGTNLDGCRQRPTCDQVLTALGDKDEARWVWFVLESIHRLTLVGAVIDQQTVPSELDIVTVAEDAAHTFLRKYDDSKANKCKILAGFVKALILSTFGAVGAVLSTVGPAAAGAVPAIANSAVASSPYLAARGAALVSWGTAFAGNLENNVGLLSNPCEEVD